MSLFNHTADLCMSCWSGRRSNQTNKTSASSEKWNGPQSPEKLRQWTDHTRLANRLAHGTNRSEETSIEQNGASRLLPQAHLHPNGHLLNTKSCIACYCSYFSSGYHSTSLFYYSNFSLSRFIYGTLDIILLFFSHFLPFFFPYGHFSGGELSRIRECGAFNQSSVWEVFVFAFFTFIPPSFFFF